MSAEASARSIDAIRALIANGRAWGGANALPRARIASIVTAAEAGARPYGLVRDAGLSWSGFHSALKRHPDLAARYAALPVRRGRKKIAHQSAKPHRTGG